eukprot:TRINITY_DN9572_c0_g1_i2.p1 TRINITY_DN9572_c0_g1~~TRINITY_DN9572_c0_g1_i2.p1  ORF type:complete len:183 (-),score=44.06 TRINITY_DN9572_c0_g1_i2:26-574(-)
MEELIQSVADAIEKDHSVRHEIHGVVRDIDTIIRKAHAAQQSIYSNTAKAAEQLTKIHGFVEQAQQQFAKISSLYPADQYYRYSDIWKSSIVSITQLLAFTHWFQSNELIPVQLVSQAINNFPVEMEDYLLGICGLPSDLVCRKLVVVSFFLPSLYLSRFIFVSSMKADKIVIIRQQKSDCR